MIINSGNSDPYGTWNSSNWGQENFDKKIKKKKRRRMTFLFVLFTIIFIMVGTLLWKGVSSVKTLLGIIKPPSQEVIYTPSTLEPNIVDEPFNTTLELPSLIAPSIENIGGKEEEVNNTNANKFQPSRPHKTQILGNNKDIVTIMVYMNGSDLEGDGGCATKDLKEMLNAISSDKVNIIVQTMSTIKWNDEFGISGEHTQRYKLEDGNLKLIDELEQLSCGDPETLSNFITWTKTHYPANRNILIMWNHGGGAVFGFGNDQFDAINTLTMDEMKYALQTSNVNFDFIGMDCCIMSSIEVCYALKDYCDYMILSEDFEPSDGWYYSRWINEISKNTSIPTEELAKIIIDDMTQNYSTSSFGTWNVILSLIDSSYVDVLYDKWKAFAMANTETLLSQNYSIQTSDEQGRIHPLIIEHNKQKSNTRFGFGPGFGSWLGELFGGEGFDDDIFTNLNEYYNILLGDSGLANLTDYYITDISAVAKAIPSKESEDLLIALHQVMPYVNKSADEEAIFGMAVTLPYGDQTFYEVMEIIYSNVGIDEEYIEWLKQFANVETNGEHYDYDGLFTYEDLMGDYNFSNDYYDYDDYNDYNNDYYDDYFTNGSYEDILSDLESIFGELSEEDLEVLENMDMGELDELLGGYFGGLF